VEGDRNTAQRQTKEPNPENRPTEEWDEIEIKTEWVVPPKEREKEARGSGVGSTCGRGGFGGESSDRIM